MSRRIVPAGAALALALTLAACSGGSAPRTPTPPPTTASPAGAATAAATAAPVPARPATLDAYPQAAAAYLSGSAAAVRDCLQALYAVWKMPLIAAGSGCRSANTDADAEAEVIAVFSARVGSTTQFVVAVFDHAGGAYRVAYTSGDQAVAPTGSTQPIDPIVGAGDIVGDGAGALAYVTTTCDASAVCTQHVEVVRGGPSGYVSLAPPYGITMVMASKITLQDTAGKKAIQLTGGRTGDATTGPLRPRTDTWAWNGSTYTQTSSVPAPSPFLYHAVRDADALFAAGSYAQAASAYLAAVSNTSLRTFYTDRTNERPELEAYALFRAGLAELMAGSRATADGYFTRASGYGGTLDRQLAGSFEAAYKARGELSAGCSAVREDIQANLGEYRRTWDFGTANPPFDPNAVCPF